MKAAPFPPPYQGQRDDLPLAVIQNPYAQYVTNYNLDTGIPTLRHGDSVFSNSLAISDAVVMKLDNYNNTNLFEVSADSTGGLKFWDITAGGAGTPIATIGAGGETNSIVQTLYFNNYLFYFSNGELKPANTGPYYYNGTTWGVAAYTWPATITIPFGGVVFKNRGYIINKDSSVYGYTGISSIAGAITAVDLASVLFQKGYLYGIRSIGLSEGIQQENVLAFVFNTGEVLVYSGSYPDSADWQIVGRFIIPKPVYYNSFVDARGDSFVITESALVSLRTLFTQGYDIAVKQGISSVITNRWKQIFAGIAAVLSPAYDVTVKGVYDQLNDRIIIIFPRYVDTSGVLSTTKSMRLIYSFKTNSWTEAVFNIVSTILIRSSTYFKNNTYYGASINRAVSKVEGATGYTDEQADSSTAVGISYNIRSAPLSTPKFGVTKISGVEVIAKTDLYTQTNYKMVADLGRQTTDAQPLSDQGTGVAKPMVNVGIEASYLQLDISGTSTSGSTLGQELYAFNLWYDEGDKGAR